MMIVQVLTNEKA